MNYNCISLNSFNRLNINIDLFQNKCYFMLSINVFVYVTEAFVSCIVCFADNDSTLTTQSVTIHGKRKWSIVRKGALNFLQG